MSVVERALNKLRRDGEPAEARVRTRSATAIGAVEPRPTTDPGSPGERVDSGRRIIVDRNALREAGYMPESGCDRQFADHYRQIKRPLIAAALADLGHENSARLIMMASALPGDGKTFTSINLALSMARERDTSVVLVDADVAKPHVSRIFGVEQEPGMLDALSDTSLDIGGCILRTDVGGLSILPAGKQVENATELFASARMAQVVRQIIEDDPRRIVLFDSAPILVSSESRALAGLVGQVLMVVRAMRTPRNAVLDALEHLSEARQVRLVLNQGRPNLSQGYYGQEAYGTYGDSAA